MENSGAVTQATLTKIERQQTDELREAITDLSRGNTEEGFDKVDNYGAIHEHGHKAERLKATADLHLAARAIDDDQITLTEGRI